MYKLVLLPFLFAAVSAGYLGGGHIGIAAPVAYAAPALHAAPAVIAAPAVAHAAVPVATSYANTYKVSVSQPVSVAHAAPAVIAAPAIVKAPFALAAAPLALGHGHGYLH